MRGQSPSGLRRMLTTKEERLGYLMKPPGQRKTGEKNIVAANAAGHSTRPAHSIESHQPINLKTLMVMPYQFAKPYGGPGAVCIQLPAVISGNGASLIDKLCFRMTQHD